MKIFIGMSGGVDSSVAAFLLKKQGHDVEGFTFVAHDLSPETPENAARVANFLSIPHHIIDIRSDFRKLIMEKTIQSYEKGETPNPCALCNREIKFGKIPGLFPGAFVSSGHYIRKNADGLLLRGLDSQKDQSYFLALVPKESLDKAVFPLGEMKKIEVKEIAARENLPLKKDIGESQDICFIEGDYRDFLRSEGVKEMPGEFIYEGRTVARHIGIPFYSLGQRRGHRVAVGERVFVRRFDLEKNEIWMGEKPLSKQFTLREVNLQDEHFKDGNYNIQIRYQSKPISGEVKIRGKRAEISLDKAGEIVAPGQIAAIYKGDTLLGGGMIDKTVLI